MRNGNINGNGNKYEMLLVFLFGGFVFKYGLDLMELLVATVSNIQATSASNTQLKMSKIAVEIEKINSSVGNEAQAIGFVNTDDIVYEEEEYYE